MAPKHRVLLIEDDAQVGKLVATQLRELGCRVDWVQDGAAGLKHFWEEPFDLVILDLILPGLDGLEVCRRIRERNRFTPIFMLTAKAETRDIVLGLEMGADDYLTKPFSTSELIARMNAIFRRIEADREAWAGRSAEQPLHRGDLVIYPEKRKVTLRGQAVELTAKEFDLLLLFARHPGRTFSRSELLREIWGAAFKGYDHTVNTHINRLRRKIERDPADPMCIRTVWGVGYRFADLEELEEQSG